MWRGGDPRRDIQCPIMLENGTIHQVPYPSWSWLGWRGFKSSGPFNAELHKLTISAEVRPELIFYMLLSDGSVRQIRGVNGNTRKRSRRDQTNAGDEAATEELRSLWIGDTLVKDLVLTKRQPENRSPILAPPSCSAVEENKSSAAIGPHIEFPVYDTGRLVFWTSHAKIVTWHADMDHHALGEIDGKCIIIFDLNLPYSYESQFERRSRNDDLLGNNDILSVDNYIKLQQALSSKDEFSAPSRFGKAPNLASKAESMANDGEKRHPWRVEMDYIVISRHFPARQARDDGTLNVMIVQWSKAETNVASRIGVAGISEDDWVKLDRNWRQVILE